MDPNNQVSNQQPSVQPVMPAPQSDPAVSEQQPVMTPETQEAPSDGSGNKKLLYGLLIILLVLLLFGALYFAYLYSTRTIVEEKVETESIEITATPTPEPTPTLENDSDLDGIIDELDREDSSLENELNSFDKEANF